jgi:hypothetical protein
MLATYQLTNSGLKPAWPVQRRGVRVCSVDGNLALETFAGPAIWRLKLQNARAPRDLDVWLPGANWLPTFESLGLLNPQLAVKPLDPPFIAQADSERLTFASGTFVRRLYPVLPVPADHLEFAASWQRTSEPWVGTWTCYLRDRFRWMLERLHAVAAHQKDARAQLTGEAAVIAGTDFGFQLSGVDFLEPMSLSVKHLSAASEWLRRITAEEVLVHHNAAYDCTRPHLILSSLLGHDRFICPVDPPISRAVEDFNGRRVARFIVKSQELARRARMVSRSLERSSDLLRVEVQDLPQESASSDFPLVEVLITLTAGDVECQHECQFTGARDRSDSASLRFRLHPRALGRALSSLRLHTATVSVTDTHQIFIASDAVRAWFRTALDVQE